MEEYGQKGETIKPYHNTKNKMHKGHQTISNVLSDK